MNIVVLLLFVVGLSTILTALSLFIAIRRNFLEGQSFRVDLLNRVESIRFGRMLKKQGIDSQKLVSKEQVTNIETQIANCLSCQNTKACDRVLDKDFVADNELAFYPNHL